jgi:hypothetical protein
VLDFEFLGGLALQLPNARPDFNISEQTMTLRISGFFRIPSLDRGTSRISVLDLCETEPLAIPREDRCCHFRLLRGLSTPFAARAQGAATVDLVSHALSSRRSDGHTVTTVTQATRRKLRAEFGHIIAHFATDLF